MNNKKQGVLTSEKPILGFHPADLMGIVIMIIPFVISTYKFEITQKILFIHWTKTSSLSPYAITTLLAVIFYAAMIARFDFFKTNNIAQALISSIRMFLDCWVFAALLSFVFPSQQKNPGLLKLIQTPQVMLLVFAVTLTWVGMKTVSGFSWALLILTGSVNAIKTNNAMGVWGAVFVLTASISMFLQVRDLKLVNDFVRDFKAYTRGYVQNVRGNMSAAAADAAQRAENVSNFVKDNVAAYTPVKFRAAKQSQVTAGTGPVYYVGKNTAPTVAAAPSRSMPAGDTEDILKALDVNGDGVVDEKDIELLRKKN